MGIFDKITDKIRDGLKADIAELIKSDADSLAEKPQDPTATDEAVASKAILTDPYFDQATQHFIQKTKMSRISNKTLKDVSVRDWLVSSIVQLRADTMLRFSRPEHRRFEMGFHIVKRDKNAHYTPEEHEEIKAVEDFIYHCGRTEKVAPGQEMLFGEFLKLTMRDAMTFGYVAIEKVLSRRGAMHHFRPVPAESTYLINQKTSRDVVEREVEAARMHFMHRLQGLTNDPLSYSQPTPRDIAYYKYVQMSYDNRVLAAFGDEDMIFKLFNPQNFPDSNGYCYGPLELAIINITNHLNVENYNSNFFTHGFAAKGLLHLKGTITQSQLSAFRRQFYNSISGTQNAWRTPIVAGLDDVQWIPLAASAREMEYINFNHHLMRTICTQFQIDPIELGLDFLTSPGGRASSQAQSNEAKINFSRERGLFPILMFYEDLVNSEILPALDKDLAAKYMFNFVGYTDATPQTDVALKQAEMTIFSSMNDLLKDVKKEPIDHPVGDLPMNQAFWALVEKNMTRGEIRATFFKDKEAMARKELAYIPGDPSFLAWNQLLLTVEQTKKQEQAQKEQMEAQQQQAQQQQAQADKQHELEQGQHARDQEKHDVEMGAIHGQQAHAAVNGPQSLHDVGKQFGATNKATHVDGQTTANPLNATEK
jgi:hypothetical protein